MKLCFREVTKSYGSNLALDHFTASLEPGIYALLGPNGSGKSTLMNILTDNLKADAGEISYTSDDGVTENVLKMGVRFREKLGFMPQYTGLYPNFTVERFLWYMAALKGLSKEKAKHDIPEILAAVELDDVPGRKIGALSGGMKQRVAIAKGLALKPKIVLMDEPFAALDAMTRNKLQAELVRIKEKENVTVIFITHNIQEALVLGSHVMLMSKQGEIKINMTNTIPKPVTPASEGYGLLWKKLNDALWEEDDGKE